jgi:nucleotide-binding universal stress UspA family protein
VSEYPESPVVVGVDGSPASAAALAWAAAESRAHSAPLLVVHVLDPRNRAAVYSPVPADGSADADGVLARVKALIDDAGLERVEHVYETGVPSLALVQHTRGARLLVVGQALSHHRGQGEEYAHGPVLGPVARACVARAECPVVVVPSPEKTFGAAPNPNPRTLTTCANTASART